MAAAWAAAWAALWAPRVRKRQAPSTANPPTNIVDFRGFDSSIILILKGWDSQAHRGSLGKFDSSNVSGDNVSMGIGRNPQL